MDQYALEARQASSANGRLKSGLRPKKLGLLDTATSVLGQLRPRKARYLLPRVSQASEICAGNKPPV